MPHLLQVDFPYAGPWGAEMTIAMDDMARSIAQEPGLIWKIWTENQQQGEAGGIYLFDKASQARAYLDKHARRLAGFGIPVVNGKIFEVNEPLSLMNRAPL